MKLKLIDRFISKTLNIFNNCLCCTYNLVNSVHVISVNAVNTRMTQTQVQSRSRVGSLMLESRKKNKVENSS